MEPVAIIKGIFLRQGLGTPYCLRYREDVCRNNTQGEMGVLSQRVVTDEK